MTPADERWKACPPGEFNRRSARLRGRRRQRYVARSAVAAAALLMLGFGLWTARFGLGPREYYFAGISCSRVQELAMAQAQGALEPELAEQEQVQAHVEQCPHCRKLFEEMGLLAILVSPDLTRWSRVLLTGISGWKPQGLGLGLESYPAKHLVNRPPGAASG
ncbi:hypothetical protein BH23PLA1_BH23PLA1_03130 [soil metagenome]